MWKGICSITGDLVSVRGAESSMRLAAQYLRLRAAYFARKRLGVGPAKPSQRILDFEVEFLEEAPFAFMTGEIFLRRAYSFRARRDDPLIIDCEQT